MPKREIHLTPEERDQLIALVSQSHNQANVIKRAYMLLHSDGGLTDQAIADMLFCSEDSVRRTRIRYLTEGMAAALEDKPRPGREPALNAQQYFAVNREMEEHVLACPCTFTNTVKSYQN